MEDLRSKLSAKQQNLVGDLFAIAIICIGIATIGPLFAAIIAWCFWQGGQFLGAARRHLFEAKEKADE